MVTKTRSRRSASQPRDYCLIALEYAEQAANPANRGRFGKWVRLAAHRFIDDLKRAQKARTPFHFDPERANHACGFIECLPHVEGKWDTPNIVLHPSHVFFLVCLFGFRQPDGSRRFTTALFATARKNAKALALDTPIPTPSGWRLMRDVQAGDEVFGADGATRRVLATSEVFIGKPCYRLMFSDGSQIVASADHLWATTQRGRKHTEVVTTEQIARSVRISGPDGVIEHNHSVPVRSGTLKIVNCEPCESVPTKCLMVDSPDHLFLAGPGLVATHNSTLAAAVGIYCQTCENENGPQVIAAATTGQQARVVFKYAKSMVERTLGLRTAFSLEPFANSIASYRNGGSFKPINAKASTQDGLNPSCTILDEIHAHKNHDLLNVLKSAAGARRNPLFLFLTTEGYESPGPWPELREFAKQVLQGTVEADHFLAVYYAVDDEDKETGTPADDDFDESTWVKANPLIDVNPVLLIELRKEAIEAKAMPGRHAEFKIKRLNRPSSVSGGWVNLSKWRQCAGPVDLEALRDCPCWGGLDLASVSDFTSFRLVWLLDGRWYTHGWRFVPRAAVHRRTERGLVPYQHWVQSGHLIVAGEDVTDYDAVQERIIGINDRFNVQLVGYDRWNAAQLVKKLEEAGVPLKEFIQGPRSFHPAMQALERAYTSGQLNHGNDPVLNWCAANMVPRVDVNMNTAPDRKRSREKIDDMVALLEAFGVAQEVAAEQPQFQLLAI